jgi:restriction system protein
VKTIEKRIVLVDGITLSNLMIDHGVGVDEIARYTLARIDDDYFEEDAGTPAAAAAEGAP